MLNPADHETHHRLDVFAKRAAEASLACVGFALPTTSLMLAAWASGFTHLGGAALTEKVEVPKAMQRLEPCQLFVPKCNQ
jgi:hypothetical protein